MRPIEKWIWLPKEQYPQYQTNGHCCDKVKKEEYTVAEFFREYTFSKKVISAALRFSGDTEYVLYCNDHMLATGPVSVGGDFLGDEIPRGQHYATELSWIPDTDVLKFYARVKMCPIGIAEFSQGHGGFMLTGELVFEDGTKQYIMTDSSWMVRRNERYTAPFCYDGSRSAGEYTAAQVIPNIWQSSTAPLLPRVEKEIFPIGGGVVLVNAGEKKTEIVEFEKIWGGFITLRVKAAGRLKLRVECFETTEKGTAEEFIFDSDDNYRGLQLQSVGGYRLIIENESDTPAEITASLTATYYPILFEGKIVTSDADLNRVLEVCAHTLKICRQMIHLDSTRHVEPLACTGDYYIESLMTAFTYGDMALAAFDVRRTAELLRNNDGRMFHTTYSLIWVQMLYDVYNFIDDERLLYDCEDALTLLMDRFETYLGDNGLIETPPDYMFIDWIYLDEISLHHPPKALGQTCLNLYYFGALNTAVKIMNHMGQTAMAVKYENAAKCLKEAILSNLYDAEKELFFEGLNTPTPKELIAFFMPENVSKRYYRCHANILAAYFGIFEKERCVKLLDRVMTDASLGECQPYFKHFLLEAVERNGLREKYTLPIIEAWKAPTKECDKGMVEGFIKPEPTYSFDHSHAWGGTPAYALPKALLGFEMLMPGFEKIRLNPSLLGLSEAIVEMPIPVYGTLRLEMKKGEIPVLTVPEGVTVEWEPKVV